MYKELIDYTGKITRKGNPVTDKAIESTIQKMEDMQKGICCKRMVEHCNIKLMEWIQPNKGEDTGTFSRFYLPLNGDKSKAVKQNAYMQLHEVFCHLAYSISDSIAEHKKKYPKEYSNDKENNTAQFAA